MRETLFQVAKMDCPSEEGLIRLALESLPAVKKINFNLAAREMVVFHENSPDEILLKIEPLSLGASIINTAQINDAKLQLELATSQNDTERRVLKWVFGINAAMFFTELIAGLLAQSTGLLADSLDMFADAAVFAFGLYAVGKTITLKKRAARLSGYLQMILAVGAFAEVARRVFSGSEPEAPVMIFVATVALIANAICIRLLSKHRDGEVHMQASWIFLTNDVIANALVIVAGVLVKVTNSHLPDLITGAIIGAVVLKGSIKILKASKI